MMGREWILVLALICFIAVEGFNNWALKVSEGLKQWSQKYSYSIAETKINLTEKSMELAENPDFLTEMSANQQNSIKGRLERQLSTSGIQEMRLVSNDCALINQALLISFGVETCRPGSNRGLYWLASPSGSILVYEQPLNDQKKLTSAIRIDRHWGMNFLSNDFEKNGFDLKMQSLLGITLNRPQENEPHFYWSHWSSLMTRPFMDINGSRIPILPFSFLLAASALLLVAGYRRRVLELSHLLKGNEEDIQNCQKAWDIDPKHRNWPAEVISRSEAKVLQQQDEITQLKESIHILRTTKEELEKEVVDLQQAETIMEQIQRTIPSILERMATWESSLSKVEIEITKNLIHDTESLALITKNWKKDIETRGARKFLRSRLETEVRGDSQNQLEDELNFITESTKTINETGLFLKENILEIIKHQKSIKKITQFWQSSLTGGPSNNTDWKFSQVMDDALLQVKITMKNCNFSLEKANWVEPIVTMEVPYTVVTGAIHQIFSAFAKINHEAHVKIQYRSGAIHDQLVFTLIQGNAGLTDGAKANLTRHINSANAIAKTHGLLVRQLPATSSHIVLAMAWRCSPVGLVSKLEPQKVQIDSQS